MGLILALYTIILVFIAISSFRRVSTVADFFVARKGASTLAVTGSLVATILGGSAIIGAIDAGPELGAASAWFMIVGALGLLALLPLAKKAYAHGRYSLPDLIENFYGHGPRMVASIVIPVAWTGIVAAQIIAAAKLLQSFVEIDYFVAAVVATIVFVGYTMAGGQYSILRTDFFQAVLIILGLVLLAIFAYVNGSSDFLAGSTACKSFPFNENFGPLTLFLLLLTYGTTFTAGPDIFSRLFCARNSATAAHSILFAAVILLPIAGIIGFLSYYGASLEGGSGARIMQIANQVLPAFLLPLIGISLLSVVLSSADTTLLSSSIILCELLKKRKGDGQGTVQSLALARGMIFVNGVLALVIALYFNDIIGTLLLALAVYAGAFTVPILWGLLGFRSKSRYVIAAITAGGILALIGKLSSTIAELPANAVLFGDVLLILAFVVNGTLLYLGRTKA